MARIQNINRPKELSSKQALLPNNTRMPVEWIAILKETAMRMSEGKPNPVGMSELIRIAVYDKWVKPTQDTNDN